MAEIVESCTLPLRLEARVREYARRFGARPAVIAPDRTLSWAQLDAAADALAGRLVATGATAGDRIGWLGCNRPEHPVLVIAARRARLALVGLNWRLSPAELDYIIRDATPRLVVGEQQFRALVPAGVALEAVDDGAGGGFLDALARAAGRLSGVRRPPQDDDPAFLLYTSGTTGRPKGVMNSLAGVEQALLAPQPHGFQPDSVLLIVPPLFHVAGAMWSQYALLFGMTQVLLPQATPAAMLDAVERHRVTHLLLVPTLVQMALAEQQRQPRDLGSVENISYGAAPMPPALLRAAADAFRCRFVQAYGMTETLCAVCHLPPAAHRFDQPSEEAHPPTGFPDPGVALRIVDPGDGRVLAPGERGEVQLRTPWPPPTYWSLPEGTASSFDADGWLHTGDVGFLDDDGCLHLVDRLGDMIISGGENVYPAEVEAVLGTHPAVADCGVVGVPHELWGEQVVAAVVLRGPAGVEPAALADWCRERLAHYKCPRRVVVLAELPRNATGKVQRRALREHLRVAMSAR